MKINMSSLTYQIRLQKERDLILRQINEEEYVFASHFTKKLSIDHELVIQHFVTLRDLGYVTLSQISGASLQPEFIVKITNGGRAFLKTDSFEASYYRELEKQKKKKRDWVIDTSSKVAQIIGVIVSVVSVIVAIYATVQSNNVTNEINTFTNRIEQLEEAIEKFQVQIIKPPITIDIPDSLTN